MKSSVKAIARAVFGLFLLQATTARVVAQQPTYERVLLPVVLANELPGAFGSRWVTRVAITNAGASSAVVQGYVAAPCSVLPCYPSFAVLPGLTFFPEIPPGSQTQGAILLIDSTKSDAVEVSLRVQDVSRQSQTWGTAIPVVRGGRFFQRRFTLTDVPNSSDFRATLRVYDVSAHNGAQVVVRIFRVDPTVKYPNSQVDPQPSPDVLITERTITLQGETRPGSPTFDLSYAQLDLGTIAELTGVDRLRIDIEPRTTALQLWAFVSVTNNETQHVTIVAP